MVATMQSPILPSIIGPCPVCEGRSALCAVCRDPANPCSIDEPGRLNYAPILYRWEMEGHRSASQATGLTPSQVSAVLRMARDLSPACEQEISQVARDAATILGIVTTSDRCVAATMRLLDSAGSSCVQPSTGT